MGKIASCCLVLIIILLTLGACSSNTGDEVKEESNQEKKKDEVVKKEAEAKDKEESVVTETVTEVVETVIQPKPLTADEHDYLDIISSSLDFMNNESGTISTLLEEADSNPSIIYDEQWNYHLNDTFTRITLFTNLLQEMKDTNTVPERFTELHYYNYESFNFMRIAGEKIMEAVANDFNEEILKEGEEYISSSHSMIESYSEELARITKEVKGEEVANTEEATEPIDSSDNMDIMSEDELLEITGNEWTLFTDEEKFDAVSNLMYLMSEENGWTFEYTETDYIDLINDFYSSGRLDIQFAGVFSSIKALEENQ